MLTTLTTPSTTPGQQGVPLRTFGSEEASAYIYYVYIVWKEVRQVLPGVEHILEPSYQAHPHHSLVHQSLPLLTTGAPSQRAPNSSLHSTTQYIDEIHSLSSVCRCCTALCRCCATLCRCCTALCTCCATLCSISGHVQSTALNPRQLT